VPDGAQRFYTTHTQYINVENNVDTSVERGEPSQSNGVVDSFSLLGSYIHPSECSIGSSRISVS
jgi:hypothetical protein